MIERLQSCLYLLGFLLQIDILSTTCLVWSLYDISCTQGGRDYALQHGDLAAPRRGRPQHAELLVPGDFERTHCFTFACDGRPSGKARQTALPVANASPQANEPGRVET